MQHGGHVAELWRYPVKSLQGERVDALEVAARGVTGDRRYRLCEPGESAGGARLLRPFRGAEALLQLQAESAGESVRIRTPAGDLVDIQAPDAHHSLSAALGRRVVLVDDGDAPAIDGPVHLLTTASLRWLQGQLPDAAIDVRRFRPNLVLDVPGEEPLEQGWLGRRLRVGAAVELRVFDPTERCAVVTHRQGELPGDASVLRRITQAAGRDFGVYADVVVPGSIRVGDEVTLLARE